MLKNLIKKIIPNSVFKKLQPFYHGVLAWDASIYFDRPSERMVVIGVTGTAGKSTTTQMLAHILNEAGLRTGYITTVEFYDGQKAFMNKHGLSMPNEILLQKQLRSMVEQKCRYAIIECTSEGLAQNRHYGINFDAALLTNLSPAHLESHGGFESYRAAKAKLFKAVGVAGHKKFFDKKIIGVNLDDRAAAHFLAFPADVKFGVTLNEHGAAGINQTFHGRILEGEHALEIQGKYLKLPLPGKFNLQNALLAISCAHMLGVSVESSVSSLKDFTAVAGRMELIAGQRGFSTYVDYAPEPAGMKSALEAVHKLPHNRIIHVFGSTGGHRDAAKRFEFGKISAQYADHIIITNDDVYDSNPEEIARNIESGIRSHELWKGEYEIILNRREAIRHALEIARSNDIVIITGKGSEQFLVLPGNKRIHWDDREVVREELGRLVVSSK